MQNTGRPVGAQIRSVRVSLGWTQADLSHHSRMSTGDISRIETGRLLPTQAQIDRLTNALGIQPSQDVQQLASR